ncbi:MAG: thermonuclease family protein [Hyphomonadaceae bacterium]
MGGVRQRLVPAGGALSRRSVLGGGVAALTAVAVGACSPGQSSTALAEGESGLIARVSDGDLVVMESGLRVRLAEVEAPAGGRQGASPEPYFDEARRLLDRVATGRPARLWYGGLTRDRYDRAIAHVIVDSADGGRIWLNGLMVRQGGARVRSWPDNTARVRELYRWEQEARAARRGVWALDHYRVRAPDDLAHAPAFAIVEGPLVSVAAQAARGAARLDETGIVIVPGTDMGAPDAALDLTIGGNVRLRGRLRREPDGGAIALTHWGQVET